MLDTRETSSALLQPFQGGLVRLDVLLHPQPTRRGLRLGRRDPILLTGRFVLHLPTRDTRRVHRRIATRSAKLRRRLIVTRVEHFVGRLAVGVHATHRPGQPRNLFHLFDRSRVRCVEVLGAFAIVRRARTHAYLAFRFGLAEYFFCSDGAAPPCDTFGSPLERTYLYDFWYWAGAKPSAFTRGSPLLLGTLYDFLSAGDCRCVIFDAFAIGWLLGKNLGVHRRRWKRGVGPTR